jgi:hypothetical protein
MAQSKGWKLGQDSFTKMIVWFKDGNVRTMYSIDWKHKLSKTISKETGLARFRKKIKEYGPLAGTVEIYDKTTGLRIAKFYEGIEKSLEDQKQ